MPPFRILVLGVLVLSACAPGPRDIPLSIECPAGAGDRCVFANAPVPFDGEQVSLPGRPFTFSRTLSSLGFVDATNRAWQAPPATLTDGASIPPIFTHIIGAPREPEFVSAAVMHDAYCGIGNEQLATYQSQSWQSTHEMFYDALIAGGTDSLRAKLMFAAVYLGGPRWPGESAPALAYAPSYRGLPRSYDRDRDLSDVPIAEMQRAMHLVKRYIETAQPTPNRLEIVRYIEHLERTMLHPAARDARRDDADGFEAPDPEPASPEATADLQSDTDDSTDTAGPDPVPVLVLP